MKPPLNLDHLHRFLSFILEPLPGEQSAPCVEFRVMKAVVDYKTNHIVDATNHVTMGGWFTKPDTIEWECNRLRFVSAYLTVNPINPELLERSKNKIRKINKGDGTTASDIRFLRNVIIDIDVTKPSEESSSTDDELAGAIALRDRILAENEDIRRASCWGCSGNGGWIIVRVGQLDNNDGNVGKVKDFLRSLAERYGKKNRDTVHVDTQTFNPNRHIGIPGVLKCKGKNDPERPWRMATFDGQSETIEPFSMDGWLEKWPALSKGKEAKEEKKKGRRAAEGEQPKEEGRQFWRKETDDEFRIRRAEKWANRPEGSVSQAGGHNKAYWVARTLVWDFGLAVSDARKILYDWNRASQPPWSETELEHKLSEAETKPDRQGRPRGWKFDEESRKVQRKMIRCGEDDPAEDKVPEIIVNHEESRVTDEAIAALGSEPDIFVRASGLSRILRDTFKPRTTKKSNRGPQIIRPPGSPRISPLPTARLRDVLSRIAAFRRWKKDADGNPETVGVHPPEWMVPQIMARGEWPGIPYLEWIVETPVLTLHGDVLETPGYDEETSLLYEPNGSFLPMPSNPTKEDAEWAKDVLLDLIADFPFVSFLHRACWISALLTPFARFAIEGPCPVFLFDGNVAGTGKSLLCDLISIIVTGRPMSRTAYPDSDEEMRKRITSIALSGDRLMLLDNIDVGFGGSALDSALTSISWKDRILGRSEMSGDLPMFTIWYGTGNNIFFRGDAHRRVIPCRLKTDENNPEDRKTFSHPHILEYASQNRDRFVLAALTILKAYVQAGCPHVCVNPLGSYERWSDLVRSAVMWITGYDPVQAQAEYRTTDPEANFREAIVKGWAELQNGDPRRHPGISTAQALQFIDSAPSSYHTLREALMSLSRDNRLPGPLVVSRKLRTLKDRNIAGLRLVCVPYVGTMYWRVERVVGERGVPTNKEMGITDERTPPESTPEPSPEPTNGVHLPMNGVHVHQQELSADPPF